MSNQEYLIELRQAAKSYGTNEAQIFAMKDVDLKVKHGEFLAIMGASGSGKSTTMNIIGCLDTLSGGDYFFQGVSVGALSRDEKALLRRNYIGFIFQGFNLLGKTTAIENVELPLLYRGFDSKTRKNMAMDALRSVGLEHVANHTPSELSGGQQQRVAIARAIATNPLVLLADEPTGNLDSAKSIEIMELLKSFNREKGITILMVTHEADMAAYASRVVHFKDGSIEKNSEVFL